MTRNSWCANGKEFMQVLSGTGCALKFLNIEDVSTVPKRPSLFSNALCTHRPLQFAHSQDGFTAVPAYD